MARHQLQYQDFQHPNPGVWADCVSNPYSNDVGPTTKALAQQQMQELSKQYPNGRYRIVKLMK